MDASAGKVWQPVLFRVCRVGCTSRWLLLALLSCIIHWGTCVCWRLLSVCRSVARIILMRTQEENLFSYFPLFPSPLPPSLPPSLTSVPLSPFLTISTSLYFPFSLPFRFPVIQLWDLPEVIQMACMIWKPDCLWHANTPDGVPDCCRNKAPDYPLLNDLQKAHEGLRVAVY